MYYTWPSSTVVIVPPPSLESRILSKSGKLFFLGTTCQKMKRCLCIPQVFLQTNPLEPEMFQIHTWILSCTTWDQKKIYFACEGNIGFWILDENFTLHGLADHHIDHFRWTNPSSVLSIMNYELQTCPWHEIKAQFQKLWFDFKYLKTKMNACMDPTTKWKIHPSALCGLLFWPSFLADDVRTSNLCKWMIIIGQEKKPIHQVALLLIRLEIIQNRHLCNLLLKYYVFRRLPHRCTGTFLVSWLWRSKFVFEHVFSRPPKNWLHLIRSTLLLWHLTNNI